MTQPIQLAPANTQPEIPSAFIAEPKERPEVVDPIDPRISLIADVIQNTVLYMDENRKYNRLNCETTARSIIKALDSEPKGLKESTLNSPSSPISSEIANGSR